MPPSDAHDRATLSRKPDLGRVRPDKITPSDRKRIARIPELDRFVDDSISGRKKPEELQQDLLRMSPQELAYVSKESKRKGKLAERRRVQNLERLPATLGFGELVKLAPGGTPRQEVDPIWGSLEAASIFPFFRAGRGVKEGVEKALDVSRPAGAEKVVESLSEARRLGRKQEALRSAERGKRVGAAARAREAAGGGEAGLRAGRAELRGEYTKLSFNTLREVFADGGADQPQIRELLDFIADHPSLRNREFALENTQGALLKALRGELPTRSEIRLLENVFGDDRIMQGIRHSRAAAHAARVVNIPRSLMATLDLSFGFRQGLVMLARDPMAWGRSWGPTLRAASSKRGYEAVTEATTSHPDFDLAQRVGVKFTDIGKNVHIRDEAHLSDIAEKIPVAGVAIRASNRAYVAMGNKQRMDLFALLLEHARQSAGGIFASVFRRARPGLDELPTAEQDEILRGIASLVNAATGRGGLGLESLERAAPLLTGGLFAPRLIASRVALLNPVYYYKLPPFARKEAARSMLQLVAAGTATLWMAKQAGAEVVLDPRNSDFGKIKIGNTRIDIWGGFQQYVVNAYRIAKGESVSSTTGEAKKLEGGFATPSRLNIAEDFLYGKASPPFEYGVAALKGKNPAGESFDPLKEAYLRLLPLGVQNAYEGYSEGPEATALHVPEFFGFGVQTYGPTGGGRKRSTQRGKPGAGGRGTSPKPGARGLSPKPGS